MATKQKSQKKQKQSPSKNWSVAFALLNLIALPIITISTICSDGFKSYTDPLFYIAILDIAVVLGFICRLKPMKFMRFVALSVVGFCLYYGWSTGEIKFDQTLTQTFYTNIYAMVALSHIAIGLLSFKMPRIISAFIGLLGLSAWVLPIISLIGSLLGVS